MSDKDIVVSSTVLVPIGPPVKSIPSYLIKIGPETIKATSKLTYKLFVAVEQPEFNVAFIHAKGFFSESSEDDIVAGYKDMIAATTQLQILEMWLPWHTIHSVRSLVFKTASKR